MESEEWATSEKVDKLYTDIAVLAATVVEISKRQDDTVRCIEVLNHNSTAIQVSIGKMETALTQHESIIRNTKAEITTMVKTGLTVLGVVMTIVFFVINYFKP